MNGYSFFPALSIALAAWILFTVGSYIGVRIHLHRRGEPEGWRFNHHGASAILGRLSFYERRGGRGVVIRTFRPFPLRWTFRRTPHNGAYSDLEIASRGWVWNAVPEALDWMDDTEDGPGLVCVACGAKGFRSREKLESHLDAHPYTSRRSE